MSETEVIIPKIVLMPTKGNTLQPFSFHPNHNRLFIKIPASDLSEIQSLRHTYNPKDRTYIRTLECSCKCGIPHEVSFENVTRSTGH